MPALLAPLLPLLFDALPYILLVAGAVALYFGIKRKGVKEERAKWEEATREQTKELEVKVDQAESQDVAVDQKVRKQIEDIKKIDTSDPGTYRHGDIFKF